MPRSAVKSVRDRKVDAPATAVARVRFLVIVPLDEDGLTVEQSVRSREYAAEVERIAKSAWRELKIKNVEHRLVLEGEAGYATAGFPDYDIPPLKRAIRKAAKLMLVEGAANERVEIPLSDRQCVIECYTCPAYLVDKMVGLWNEGQRADIGSPERGRLESGAQGKRSRLQVPPQTGESTVNEFRSLLKQKRLTDADEVQGVLDAMNVEVSKALKPSQQRLRVFLEEISRQILRSEPKQFGTYEANRQFADELRDLLYRLELRLKCPDCGAPSILVCPRPARTRHGTFQFYHREASKQVRHATASVLSFPLKTMPAGE